MLYIMWNKARKWTKKNITKPYFTKKNHRGYNNRQRLYRDVANLKKMINAEKQNVESSDTTVFSFAQKNSTSTGSRTLPLMPTLTQGVGEDQRKGDSIKVCSCVLKLNVQTNKNNTLQDVGYKFYLVRQPTNPDTSASSARDNFLETNPFSGVIDMYSNRDYQHFKDYEVIGVVQGKLTQNTNDSIGMYKSNYHTLARKCNFHIRYNKGTTDILNNKIWLIAVASEGDINALNYIQFQYSYKVYFYDN